MISENNDPLFTEGIIVIWKIIRVFCCLYIHTEGWFMHEKEIP